MNHEEYIGKTLKDLIKDIPNYAVNYYYLTYNGKVYPNIKDILDNEELLNAKIEGIGDLTTEYVYWVTLIKVENLKFVVDMLSAELKKSQDELMRYEELIFYDRKWITENMNPSYYKVRLERNRKIAERLFDECNQLSKAISILGHGDRYKQTLKKIHSKNSGYASRDQYVDGFHEIMQVAEDALKGEC